MVVLLKGDWMMSVLISLMDQSLDEFIVEWAVRKWSWFEK